MAVLTNKTNFKAGDAVTAEVINDTVETAIVAKQTADDVSSKANNGEFNGKSMHIRFSAFETGEDSSETWTPGKDYIGIAISNDAVVPLSAYKWIRFVGEKGADFTLNGTTLYIKVK